MPKYLYFYFRRGRFFFSIPTYDFYLGSTQAKLTFYSQKAIHKAELQN